MNSKTGNILVAALVAVVISVGAWVVLPEPTPVQSVPADTTPSDELGSNVLSNIDIYVNGVGAGDVIELSKYFSIPAGQTTAAYRNTTGRTIYVDKALIQTSAQATSTKYVLSISTSTSATIADYSLPNTNLLSFVLASSSGATVANNLQGDGESRGITKVAPGEYIIVKLFNGVANGNVPLATCNGSTCETATSTNRGFNLEGFIHYFYKR